MRSRFIEIIFTLWLVPFTLNGAAQQDTIWNRTDGNGLKQGYWRKYYPEGRLMYRGFFIDDRPAGEMKRFYEAGQLKAELLHAGDTTCVTMYFRNGQKGASGKYVRQQRDGVWNYYSYYTGSLSCRENYRTGLKEGPTLKYFPGGSVAEVIYWSRDHKEGPWKRFYEDSTLRLSARYESDQLNGPYRLYNRSHRLILDGTYKNGKMEGDWKFYDDDGKILHTLSYSDGEILNEEELMEWAREFMENAEKNQGKIPEPDLGNFFEKIP